jgi:hypothetical protein
MTFLDRDKRGQRRRSFRAMPFLALVLVLTAYSQTRLAARTMTAENAFAPPGITASNPALVDIDADGDQDLFIGSDDGAILFYRNVGTAAAHRFQLDPWPDAHA